MPHPATPTTPFVPRWSLFGLALVLVAIAGLALSTRSPDSGPAPTGSSSASSDTVSQQMRELGESLARRDADDPTALGDSAAPVVLIAYSDYQCPFCGTWVEQTLPDLVERYVDTGMLRIEWREFPYLGQASRTLALGARAAAEQDLFWEYHAHVYDAQEELEDAGDDLRARMADLAVAAGARREQFTADLDRDDLAAHVEADFTEGQRIGVSGTPAFLVNGDPVMGAQPLEAFTTSIDAALAAADG